jgi:hypothetical protein
MNSPRIVDGALITLELSVGSALDYFRATLWPVLWTTCAFFVFVCWDMAGDAVEWKAALWAPLSAISFSLFIWMIMRARKSYHLTRLSKGERGGAMTVLPRDNSETQNPIGEQREDDDGDTLLEGNQRTISFQIESGAKGPFNGRVMR